MLQHPTCEGIARVLRFMETDTVTWGCGEEEIESWYLMGIEFQLGSMERF